MNSIINSLLEQLFPRSSCRCLNIGLDASGKTTILYRLKLGEAVTTIPTIGFNVEDVSFPGVVMTIWDVGGCDKIRPLWRHYYKNTQALIFIVDCNDLERLDEVLELFSATVSDDELLSSTILILFNKIDIASSTRKEEIQRKFLQYARPYLQNRVYHVQDCSAKTGEGLDEAFIWLIKMVLSRSSEPIQAKAPEPTEKDRLEIQLEEWLTREDSDDEEFLAQLANYTLDSWDHYTHLRIAFILLNKHGRREGMKLIFAGIKAFIENSPRTRRGGNPTEPNNRGTTFHETMTYFWVHMVHYAIESIKITAATTGGTMVGFHSNAITPWKRFLLMNPQLANGGLFLHYYTKQRMLMDPDARSMVLLPDKLPLPSLLASTQPRKPAQDEGQSADQLLPRQPLTDAHFVALLAQRRLPGWGHEVKLRVIFLLLCRWGISGKSSEAILQVLQEIEKDGFHHTISRFWVQLTAYHMAVAIKGPAASIFTFTAHVAPVFAAFNASGYAIPDEMSLPIPAAVDVLVSEVQDSLAGMSTQEAANNDSIVGEGSEDGNGDGKEQVFSSISFATFLSRPHCQPLRNPLLYFKYYSRFVIDQPAAAFSLAMPDLKQFPSVV